METVCGIVLIRTVSSQRLLDRTSRRWATSWSSQASEVRWLHSLRPTFLPWIRRDSIHGDYTTMHSFVWLFRVVTGVGLIDYILRSVSFKFSRHDGFCWISSHYIYETAETIILANLELWGWLGGHADCIRQRGPCWLYLYFESWFVGYLYNNYGWVYVSGSLELGILANLVVWGRWKMFHNVWIDGSSLIVSLALELDSAKLLTY